MDSTDPDAVARATRTRRLAVALAGLFVVLLTVGTSVIFAGAPGIGLALVVASVLALIVALAAVLR